MKTITWLAIGALSFLIGVFMLRYLVEHPLAMSLYLTLVLCLTFLVVLLIAASFRRWQIAISLALAVVCLAAGYLVTTMSFLAQREERDLPPISRAQGASEGGHTAIVYFTHGEPPAYSYMPWIETFHELDADQVSFVPKAFRPFFLSGVRRFYLQVGGSPHNKVHQFMLRSLERSMPQAQAQGVRFYLSFLDSDPRPDEAVIRAVNAGADKIILTAVFLTESSHTQAGWEMVDALDLERYGVTVCKTEPLWDSDSLQAMFTARAAAALGDGDKSKVGVLLVGHGQPDDWDQVYPTQTEQENLFREAVRRRFIAEGYREENIALAWMEFKSPHVPEAAALLAANGIEKLLVYSASISADAIHSEIQVPAEVDDAHLPTSIEVIHMGAWGDDPHVIAAIREKIRVCDSTLVRD